MNEPTPIFLSVVRDFARAEARHIVRANLRPVYNDDRPGMMRIHVAQQRADALEARFTRDELRQIARDKGVSTGYPTKRDLAVALAFAGVKP